LAPSQPPPLPPCWSSVTPLALSLALPLPLSPSLACVVGTQNGDARSQWPLGGTQEVVRPLPLPPQTAVPCLGMGVRGKAVGFGVPGSVIRVSGFGFRISGSRFRAPGFGFLVPCSEFRVSGFGFCVPGSWFRVSGFGFRVYLARCAAHRAAISFSHSFLTVSGFATWPPCFATRIQEFVVWGVGFRVQGSGFRVQGSGFRVQGSGFRVRGLGFGGWGFRV